MKRRLPVLLALAAIAFDAAALLPSPKALEGEDSPNARPPPVEFRATQINRCPDASGRIKLQDTPCNPVPSPGTAPADAASAVDVVELSALPPRDIGDKAPAIVRDPESRGMTGLALSLAWKLALFIAVGYAIFRGVRAWRDAYALKTALESQPRRTR